MRIAARWLGIVVAAGCGGATVVSVAQVPPPEPAPVVAPVSAPAPWTFRQLAVGTRLNHATRTTFVLTLAADRATLVQTDEHADGAQTIAQADRDARWLVAATRTYRGPLHGDVGALDGAAAAMAGLDLDLATDDMQPLHLHCVRQTVAVAAAAATRIASASAANGCDPGVWSPSASVAIAALACGAAGQSTEDADDDDRLMFAPAPGVEWAFENDDCALRGGGLRVLRPDAARSSR